MTVARPSLDDVYLRYAGRSFSAAERDQLGDRDRPDEEEPDDNAADTPDT